MLKLENVATPLTAATLVVPDTVPPAGFTPSATVTVPVKPVATLPWASCAVTCTAGVSVAPAAAFVGCAVKASWVAAPAVTVTRAVWVAVTPAAAAATVFAPATVDLKPPDAPPFAAGGAGGWLSVYPATVAASTTTAPPPGFAPSATVTLPVKPATALPSASCAVTCTAGAIAWPAVVVPGCPVNASCVAGPGVMLNAALAVPVRPAAVAASV